MTTSCFARVGVPSQNCEFCFFFASSIACTLSGVKWPVRRQTMLSQIWRKSAGTIRSGACGSIWLNTGKLTKSRHSKNGQGDSSFLIPRVVLRGRSQLVESSVWLVPPVRIDRLKTLSWFNGSCGAWPFFVRRVICLVPPVSVCTWKKKREEERGKRKEEKEKEKEKRGKRKREREEKEKKKTRGKEKREEEKKRKKRKKILKLSTKPKNPPDELSHHDSKKKKPEWIIWHFSSKVQNFTFFSISSMIRIRFSGSGELNWKAFSRAR